MQNQGKFFDDLAKVLNGAAGTFAGMAREAQSSAREKARDFVAGDFVSREEFETVKDMLANARAEITALKTRIDVMEATSAAVAAAPAAAKSVNKKAK
jgi:BMFP domain-containing protein YqiC